MRSQAKKAALVSTLCNCALVVAKVFAGVVGKSSAMISDAVNSAGDVLTGFLVVGGISVSGKKADEQHQYGHEKIESLVSIFLAALLFFSGAYIGYQGILKILSPQDIIIPSLFPLVVAGATMVVKEVLYRYTISVSRKTGSSSLKATAWDHRSDVFSSLGVFVGILGARLGLPILDPIASLIIALLIVKVSLSILKSAMAVLLDSAVSEKTRTAIEATIKEVEGVKRIDLLKTRLNGSTYYVEVEITCCRNLPLFASHEIAEHVHDVVERRFDKAKHVVVHTNPCSGQDSFCSGCVC